MNNGYLCSICGKQVSHLYPTKSGLYSCTECVDKSTVNYKEFIDKKCINETPSIELKIRKEVMELVDLVIDDLYDSDRIKLNYTIEVMTKIKDRLNLLWS